MAPKCGTTSIASMLNEDMLKDYTNEIIEHLNNPEYKKIIIIRRSIISRFLSGFYEDLLNNSCYDNMDITFHDYLLFLYNCYKKKIPNVSIVNTFDVKYPIWFGEHSNVKLSITDENGLFCSHIMSQKYAISNTTNIITCKNVQLIELEKLSKWISNVSKCNVKNKNTHDFSNCSFSNLKISYIKSNEIIVSKESLTDDEINMINEIYNEDYVFLQELVDKYGICE